MNKKEAIKCIQILRGVSPKEKKLAAKAVKAGARPDAVVSAVVEISCGHVHLSALADEVGVCCE